jgi:hypothetical protein
VDKGRNIDQLPSVPKKLELPGLVFPMQQPRISGFWGRAILLGGRGSVAFRNIFESRCRKFFAKAASNIFNNVVDTLVPNWLWCANSFFTLFFQFLTQANMNLEISPEMTSMELIWGFRSRTNEIALFLHVTPIAGQHLGNTTQQWGMPRKHSKQTCARYVAHTSYESVLNV